MFSITAEKKDEDDAIDCDWARDIALDPLGSDQPDDTLVLTSRRAISRVALVAAETAGRFQREQLTLDPMAWMLAPRRVFDGRSALDACLERDECMRGILVHGLGLGLDVERDAVDVLAAQDDDDEFDDGLDDHEFRYLYGMPMANGARGPRKARLRLYTATIVTTSERVMVQAFLACVASSRKEVATRVASRFGPALAEHAEIRAGFHPASPLVLALVPAAVSDLIRQVETECSGPQPRTFEFEIQQRIRA